MSVICLLPALVARCVQSVAIGDHNIIAAVGGRVVDGFMFAHKEDGNARRQAA